MEEAVLFLGLTHRLLSSSFVGLPYRILNMNHKKALLRSSWVGVGVWRRFFRFRVIGPLASEC